MIQFASLPLWINIAAFTVAAVSVWMAGTRIAKYADTISNLTGIGHAVIGIVLLGGVTSLPEIAATTTSAVSGNAALAVNNLLGGVALQVTLLAVADVAVGRAALTAVVPDPIVLLQGTFNILLQSIVVAGIIVGDRLVFGIGIWPSVLLLVYVYGIWMIARSEGSLPWHPVPAPKGEGNKPSEDTGDQSLSAVLWKAAATAGVIVVAGFILSRTAEAIAEQTGLGSSFVGAVLLAAATSLPEASTVLSAARLGNYTMAIADILGTNMFNVTLLVLVDAVIAGEPILNRIGRFSAFAAALGIVVNVLLLIGLIERRDRTVLRMGYDSVAILAVYLAGLVILYNLR